MCPYGSETYAVVPTRLTLNANPPLSISRRSVIAAGSDTSSTRTPRKRSPTYAVAPSRTMDWPEPVPPTVSEPRSVIAAGFDTSSATTPSSRPTKAVVPATATERICELAIAKRPSSTGTAGFATSTTTRPTSLTLT